MTHVPRRARDIIGDNTPLQPVLGALATLERHAERILARWTSRHSTARLKGLNGLVDAARTRARGDQNTTTFAAFISRIAAGIHVFVST